MLAVEIGLNEACRKLDVTIPTGKSWARRNGWQLPKRPVGRAGRTFSASSLHSVAEALVETHKKLETKTKTGLMQTAAKAAEHAAEKPPLDVSNTSQLRDLAQSAARIFGWGNNDKPGVQLNQQFCISQEQLEQIRQLRELVVYEATARWAATAVSGVICLRRLRNKDNVMMGNVTTALQVKRDNRQWHYSDGLARTPAGHLVSHENHLRRLPSERLCFVFGRGRNKSVALKVRNDKAHVLAEDIVQNLV